MRIVLTAQYLSVSVSSFMHSYWIGFVQISHLTYKLELQQRTCQ